MTHKEKRNIVEKLFNPQEALNVPDRKIFDLGFRTKSELEKYLFSEFYTVTNYSELGHFKSSFTKRMTRVWKTISDTTKRIRSENHAGIYALRRRFYYDVLAYVVASNVEEATLLGNVMLGYLLPKNSILEATFHEFGSKNLVEKNQSLLNDIDAKLKRHEAFKKERDSLLTHRKTLQIIIDQLKG